MRFARLLALALLAVLAAAVPVQAASRLVIRGRGYGHGVGMSQFGAFGYAKHGWGYRAILGHYYSGTSIGRVNPARQVRVLLAASRRSVAFTGATAAGGRALNPGRVYSVTRSGLDRLALRSPTGRTLARMAAPLDVTGHGPLTLRGTTLNGVRNGAFRGRFVLRAGVLGGVTLVNQLGLEPYVRGVISAESPPSWPAEALKAQAVAARTYAITTSAGGSLGFDQYPDTRSQVYRGVRAETATTDAATRATEGEVVTYRGDPVVTYFFSTSGGRTENVENSFIGATPRPWLRSVDDPYDDASPRHKWIVRMSMRTAAARLRGLVRGSFRGIRVVARGESPRVVRAVVLGSRGRTAVTGPQLRARLRLFDTWASFARITSKTERKRASEKTPAPDQQSGGTPPDVRAARVASAGATTVSGDILPGRKGQWLRLQRHDAGRWVTVAWTALDRRGRYRLTLPGPGRYRVLWRGLDGPVVVVAASASAGRSAAK
jgi:stage II sporulation protein D